MNNPPTDRPRALHFLEAADFVRDAHFRDGLTVQEISAALRHTADAADPMVGSLARDGFGLDEIAAMLAEPAVPAGLVAVPPTTTARDRVAEALYAHNHPGWAIRYIDLDQDERDTYLARAAAVLAVLPAGSEDTTTTRADTLREAADHLAKQADELWAPETTAHTVMHADAAELRRLAAETQPSEPAAAPVHVGGGANAEDCPACKGATPPPYPWTCPSPDAASAGVQTDEETNHG